MEFNISVVSDRTVADDLVEVWEQSVKATHTFLTLKDIQDLRPVVKEGISGVEELLCIRNERNEPEAFMGISGNKLEMLFVHPRSRGTGLGKELAIYAIRVLGVRYVDVNEQNPQAIGFYEHLGFNCFARSETDGQGNPFPILHLKWIV